MLIDVEKRNVLLLAGTQALFQTVSVMVITIAGVVGWILAADKSLATLPIAMMMVAAAVTMIPASLFMQRYGRKAGFLLGAALGGVAGLLAAIAIWRGSFLCLWRPICWWAAIRLLRSITVLRRRMRPVPTSRAAQFHG